MVIARNSNLLGKITVLVMVSFVVNTALALDGSGTQEDPWRIRSLDDFNDFAADANYWAGFTRLETDVNLAGREYDRAVIAWDTDNSNQTFEGTAFNGVFDGNDHKVLNLTVDSGCFVGLFGRCDDGEVRRLGLEGGCFTGEIYVAGLVGINYGTISDCYSIGDVNGIESVGGLIGLSSSRNIVSNCYSAGNVAGDGFVGGLAGSAGSISNCHSTASVSGSYAGGLVGENYGTISNCYSTGDVNGLECVGGLLGINDLRIASVSDSYSTGDVSGGFCVGGLVGFHFEGSISDCYSAGDVNGLEWVGGLSGANGLTLDIKVFAGDIYNSYATGDVQGDSHVGGLVGHHEYGEIERSYWDIKTSNEHNMCGSQEEGATGCDNSHGKITSEMHQKSTFTDWDFINVWNIGENQTYPYLRADLPSDINKDGIVNFLDVAITANQWMQEE